MTYLEDWLRSPLAPALGWAIVHSLWQGAVLAAALACALAVLRPARLRYAAACLVLLVMFGAFCATFSWQLQHPVPMTRATFALRLPPVPEGVNQPFDSLPSPFRIQDYLAWLAPLWTAGVCFFQLRAMAAWWNSRRLRRRGVCAAPALWRARLTELQQQLSMSSPVVLLESALADVPVVIGYVRPVILMPVGLMAGIPSEQVEGILLHELAHIRRHDFVVNLLQIIVESVLFYHPAAWWVSGTIRAERENCCDDVAVAAQGNALAYASALTLLETRRGAVRDVVLAANGGSLMKRIRRLLDQPEGPRAALAPVLSAALLTVTAAAVLTAWQSAPPPPPLAPLPSQVSSVPPSAPPAPASPEVTTVPPAPPPAVPLLSQARDVPPPPPAQPARPASPASPVERRMPPLPPPPPPPPPAPPSPYLKWVTQDVAYIIQDEERIAFRRLQSDDERENFIEQFWNRRDPTPGTLANEMKEEHYRRIAYVNEHYTANTAALPGWKTDRGRMYIAYGPPNQKESHPAGSVYTQPGSSTLVKAAFEKWMYRWIDGVGNNVVIDFVDQNNDGTYRMTLDPNQEPPAPENRKMYYLQGKAVRPGGYPLTEPTRVLSALVKAGGFTDFADKKRIVIMRLTGERLNFNYNEVIRGTNMDQNVLLEPGDIIIVN